METALWTQGNRMYLSLPPLVLRPGVPEEGKEGATAHMRLQPRRPVCVMLNGLKTASARVGDADHDCRNACGRSIHQRLRGGYQRCTSGHHIIDKDHVFSPHCAGFDQSERIAQIF